MLNCQLNIFSPISIAELLKVVGTVESKSCILDPQPAVFFLKKKKTNKQKKKQKKHFDMLPPTLCMIVKLFVSGTWSPACFSEIYRPITITQETFPRPRSPW